MGIRKTWVSALQLYGRSFSKTWHLGILYGAILTISFATSPALTAKEPIIKILGLALPPMVFLFSVYLSSLIFLRIHKANIGQNISLKDSLVFVNQKYLKVLAGLLLVSIITSLGGMGLLLPGSLHLTTSSSTYIPWIYTLGSNISFIILLLTSVLFSLTLPLILLDDAGIIEGLKRSCN